MIGIVYIGQPRFKESTKLNHQLLFDRLSEVYKIKIYDLSTDMRSGCRFNPEVLESRGNLQLWDFADCIDKVDEDIIIKIRTDLWFTPSSIETIFLELENIVKENQDVSFLGHNFKKTYAEKYLKYSNIKQTDNVRDLVIIFNKLSIRDPKEIFRLNEKFGFVRSGNKIHGQILKDTTRAANVFCQLYLVRENLPKNIDPWTVCYKFIASWNQKKARDAMAWILTMKYRYDEI
jgi:hypothetical protein